MERLVDESDASTSIKHLWNDTDLGNQSARRKICPNDTLFTAHASGLVWPWNRPSTCYCLSVCFL